MERADSNGQQQPEMDRYRQKQTETDRNGTKQTETDCNTQKGTETRKMYINSTVRDRNGQKQTKVGDKTRLCGGHVISVIVKEHFQQIFLFFWVLRKSKKLNNGREEVHQKSE